jgi:hypothetical protein
MNLDTFTRAYIECALWVTNDESDKQGGVPLARNYGIENIEPEALARIVADCKQFQEANAADLAQYTHVEYTPDAMGGYDYFLTRNGHGTGFWDRISLPEAVGERLTAAARAAGEVYFYVGDDSQIYVSPWSNLKGLLCTTTSI